MNSFFYVKSLLPEVYWIQADFFSNWSKSLWSLHVFSLYYALCVSKDDKNDLLIPTRITLVECCFKMTYKLTLSLCQIESTLLLDV